MKVLQICAAYKPAFVYGGPTMSVSMLSEQLAKTGVYTEVYATTANGKTELPVTPGAAINVDGVKVTYFKRITKDHTHFSPALFRKLWKDVRSFDLVHIHAWWNLVSLFSCLIALIRGVPVAVSPRGTLSAYSFHNKSIGIKWLIHRLWGKPMLKRSFIHVTSGNEDERIKSLIQTKKSYQLPNFVKLPVTKTESLRNPGEELKLLFLSRIEEKKGLDILLSALHHLDFPYRLTIAGSGNEAYVNRLKVLAADLYVDQHIEWLGFQDDGKFALLAGHDLMVLPSHDENFGNVVIESLSEGTAVLISKQVGLADYVSKNILGWTCETDVQSVNEMLNLINTQRRQLFIIRKNAPEMIRHDFNETNLVERYTAMYNDIITNG